MWGTLLATPAAVYHSTNKQNKQQQLPQTYQHDAEHHTEHHLVPSLTGDAQTNAQQQQTAVHGVPHKAKDPGGHQLVPLDREIEQTRVTLQLEQARDDHGDAHGDIERAGDTNEEADQHLQHAMQADDDTARQHQNDAHVRLTSRAKFTASVGHQASEHGLHAGDQIRQKLRTGLVHLQLGDLALQVVGQLLAEGGEVDLFGLDGQRDGGVLVGSGGYRNEKM